MVSVVRVSQVVLFLTSLTLLHGIAFAVPVPVENSESVKTPSISEMIDSLNQDSRNIVSGNEAIKESALTMALENNNKILLGLEGSISRIAERDGGGIPLTAWLGIFGFILSVLKIIYDLLSKKKDKISSKRDNFWLREVIFPKTIYPLDITILENEFRFRNFSELTSNELEDFIYGFENLKDQVGLVSLLSPELLDSIDEAIDDLISVVANSAEPGNVYNEKAEDPEMIGDPFLICYKRIIGHFMDAHQKKEHKMALV